MGSELFVLVSPASPQKSEKLACRSVYSFAASGPSCAGTNERLLSGLTRTMRFELQNCGANAFWIRSAYETERPLPVAVAKLPSRLSEELTDCSPSGRSEVSFLPTSGKVRPLNAAALQALSEYLWQFTSYNNVGNVVLSSAGATLSNGLTHSLIIASVVAGSANSCDTINVVEWKHSLDANSGALTLSVAPLWSFHAQYSHGAVSVCAS